MRRRLWERIERVAEACAFKSLGRGKGAIESGGTSLHHNIIDSWDGQSGAYANHQSSRTGMSCRWRFLRYRNLPHFREKQLGPIPVKAKCCSKGEVSVKLNGDQLPG